MDQTDTAIIYSTVVGSYRFLKAAPYLVKYATSEGDVLVVASTFTVLSPGIVPFVKPTVLNATDYRYEVRYGMVRGTETIGTVTISYDFRDDGPPKITAVLASPRTAGLSLTWVSLTTDTVAAGSGTATNFASVPTPLPIGTANFRISVGPVADTMSWPHRLILDWSDAKAGSASVGRISVPGLTGPSVLVAFPVGMSVVDPSIAGTSTFSSATDYPIQRKTFEYGGRFWSFWYDGSSIVYATSQVSYANGQNSVVWSSKVTTPSGSLPAGISYRGFDVDQRAGTVLVGYIPPGLTAMAVLVGSITGGVISWYGPFAVTSWSTAEAGIPSIAIGTDGYFWAGFVWKPSASRADYYRSINPGSASFGFSYSIDLSGVPADSAVRLAALSNGSLLSFVGTKGYSTIITARYGTGGWSGYSITDIGLPTADARGSIMSAVSDDKDNVHLVFQGDNTNAPGIRHLAFLPGGGISPWPPEQVISQAYQNQPTVARDLNGDLHVFWLYADAPGGIIRFHIRYARQLPGSGLWSGYTEPWSYHGEQRSGLTAGAFASSQVFLLWTQGDFSPFNVDFGAIATPMDTGSQTGQPWNRQGLSPFQSYFSQLSEFVSPGSGLLTVKQTDFMLPGRKLDVDISRVFVTPRAFDFSGATPTPYLFESYPFANLGTGWQLNFPWISSQYLHLWDGQMYVLKWVGNDFENHDGEHFLLRRSSCGTGCYTYILYAKSGTRFNFDSSRQLTSIADLSGNAISFYYASGRIDYLLDTIARRISFTYNGDGTLSSISSGGVAVSYAYQSGHLRSVADALNRQTLFDHTDTRTSYLLTAITYPTGAKSVYTWSNPSVIIGSDLQAFYVTLQNTLNSQGQSIRSNQYDYTVVTGKVTYVKVTSYDAGVAKGSTVQLLDSLGGKSTTILRDAAGNQLNKQVTWFGGGGVGQVDFYPGASTTPSYSTLSAYDDWGNLIYSKDPIGHEKFASYVNTRYQGGFYAPGQLTPIALGNLFSDDFEDRDLSDWTLDQTAGPVGLDYTTFASAPPAVKIVHNGGPSGGASATHTFVGQSTSFVAEITVRAEETNKEHFLLLRSSTSMRVYVNMYLDGFIRFRDNGTGWTAVPGATYQAQQWYRIAFEVFPASNTYNIWVNGRKAQTGAPLLGSGAIDRMTIQASYTAGPSAAMFVDNVKVFQGTTLSIGGLQPGQIVTYSSLEGFTSDTEKASAQGWATLSLSPSSFSYGIVNVYGVEGSQEYASPWRVFWGGDMYVYTKPWNAFPARTTSGFLRSSTLYVDDSLPCGATAVGDTDGWDWAADLPASGSQYHRSMYLTGTHQHYFADASCTVSIGSGNFFLQYVQVPSNQYPSEIMQQFRDLANSWEHRAYWGSNFIALGTDGTNSRRSMGRLPTSAGRWFQLITKADDVGMNGLTLEGWAYTLFGGRAFWDYSGVGGSEFGEIRISGLQPTWTATLYDIKGNQVASATVPTGSTVAAINVYGASIPIRAFPFDGFYIIAGGGSTYRSPVLSFWGGDTYQYAATDFYPNAYTDLTFPHDQTACTLEYQTGRGATPQVPVKACYRYTSDGLMDRSKVNDSGSWRETQSTYGTNGILSSVTDPKGNSTFYDYSATYGNAYPTRVRDSLGTRSRSAYDPLTGLPTSVIDGRGYLSRRGYDLLGRPTDQSSYDLPPASEVVYLDMEWTTQEPTPRMEDLSAHGNHGTIIGTTPVAGKLGVARSFDGNSRIAVPSSSSLTNWKTVAGWFKVTTNADYRRFFAYGSYLDSNYALVLMGSAANAYRIYLATKNGGGAEKTVWTDFTPPIGKWFHLAVVLNGSNTKIYVNGVVRGTGTDTDTANFAAAFTVACDGSGVSCLNASADEVYVFNTGLIASDIGLLATLSYGLLSSTTTAYDDIANVVTVYEPTTRRRQLHFDMETILNAKMEDLAGHGTHGTITGTTPVAGRYGNARTFSGTGDEIVASPSVQGNIGWTVMVWFYWNGNTLRTFEHPLGMGVGHDATFYLATTNGNVNMKTQDAAGATVIDATLGAVTANTWHHVAMSFDGASVRGYLDGVLKSTLSGPATAIRSNNLVVGADGPATNFFGGRIDEVHMFDRPLGDSDVLALYQGVEKGFYQKAYFDSLGRATTVTRRDMFSSLTSWQTNTYNFQDKVVSTTVARDATSTFTTTNSYDFLARPTGVTYPDYPGNPATVTYDDVNRIRTVVGENGRKMQYLSDISGRTAAVREFIDAVNYYTTSYGYDEMGNLLSVTNALNQLTRHDYDNLNRLKKTTYPDATRYAQYTYDGVGNLQTRRDRAGQVTTYNYDNRYRLASIDYSSTTPNPDVTYAYDLNDNPTLMITNPSAPMTTVTDAYDGLNRVVTETTTVGGTQYPVDYSYDLTGRVTRLTYPQNANGSRSWVDYAYDAVGRTLSAKDPSRTFSTFSYFADDLVKDSTMGPGVTDILQSSVYNGRGWPTSIKATYGATTYLDLPYTYDPSGNVLTMGPSTFTYDNLSRLKTASGGFGSLTYAYDALGNRLTEDKSPSTLYTLRPNGNGPVAWSPTGCTSNWDCVDEASSDGDSTYVRTTSIGATDLYSLPDLPNIGPKGIDYVEVTAVARADPPPPPPPPPCPPVCKTSVGPSSTEPDGQGVIQSGTSNAIFLRVNTYRGSSRSLGYSFTTNTERWTTNPATGQPWTSAEVNALQAGVEAADVISGKELRVTQLSVSVKVFDGATYRYGSLLNELTSVNRNGTMTSFTYDTNGNQVSKQGGGSFRCYEWTPENLLSRVKSVSASCAETGTQVQAYTYDSLGRRVKVDSTSSSTWTVSIVSGMDTIYEKDNSGAVTKYVYANGMRIAKINPDNSVYYYLADHLGSTRQVRKADRSLVFSTDYEPFGKPFGVNGSEAYKFTGEKHDDPTGLVFLRARQYDPETGRFLSPDPVLGSPTNPATLNRYVYVSNNPLRYTDPTGEWLNIVIGAIIGAAVGYVGCGLATGGWTSGNCLVAAGAGALIGAVAGATFGASLAIAGSAGLGTAAAGGGFTFAGLSGLAAFTFAGAVSGAVAGGAGYMLSGGIAVASGKEWQFNGGDFVHSVGMGAIEGAIGGAAGYGLGVAGSRLGNWFKSWRAGGADLDPSTVGPGALEGKPTVTRDFGRGPEDVSSIVGKNAKEYYVQSHENAATPHWHIRDTGGRYVRNPLDTSSMNPAGGKHWFFGDPLPDWWP